MKKYILGIISCFLLMSCADSLDLFPHSAISPQGVTEKDLPALRMGMYNSVQNAGDAQSFILFDIIGGTLATSTGNPRDLINSTLSPLNSLVANGWNGYYSALYRVNNVISITENIASSSSRDLIAGEAHYFRAYIYYCLATRWGAVPIIRKNTMDLVSRDPLSDVWAFVESELDLALSLLSTSSNYYYVSKDAATALKARVMLSEGKKTEAAQLAESLITSGKYKLDTFEKIFRKLANTEVIFAFENLSTESGNNISSLFYTYAHPNKGSYSYRPPQDVVTMYDGTNDTRKAISLTNVSGSDCINKYPSGQTGTDPVIISRLSEMYLISAEAQGKNDGVARLNELRRFRGLTDIFPSTDNAYIDAILLERKKELLAENFMYYDYVRTGKAVEVLGLLPYQLVLPIPGKELQLNPNLTPNPGY